MGFRDGDRVPAEALVAARRLPHGAGFIISFFATLIVYGSILSYFA
jgi:hypothetical protein